MNNQHRQEALEAMYSQKNNHAVLHSAIQYEMDKLLINWSLRCCILIKDWLQGKYYPSKDKRITELRKVVDEKGLEHLVIAITAAVLHVRHTQTIQQAVGYLQAYLPGDDTFARAVTAGELLGLCSRENGLFTIERQDSETPATIVVNYWDDMDGMFLNTFDWINDTSFNPPMVCEPIEVTDNYHCGYLTINEPLILGKLTMHELKQDYVSVNHLNKIEWLLDPNVLAEPELPGKPLETPEQHLQFTQMVQDSNFVYKLMGSDPFHLCWQPDSRGRLYSHGYHINLQAAQYKKACLSFNRFEVLT